MWKASSYKVWPAFVAGLAGSLIGSALFMRRFGPSTSGKLRSESQGERGIVSDWKENDSDESLFAEALEPLSAQVLRQRLIGIFPDGYLALIAIIQGAAFGLLAITVLQQLSTNHKLVHVLAVSSQAASVIVVLVIVTHLYLLLTAQVRWTPTILDTLIPYLIGAGELGMAMTVGHTVPWWISLSVLVLAGMFAFWHTSLRITPAVFGRAPGLYKSYRRTVKSQILYCGILLFLSIAVIILNSVKIGSDWIYAAAPWVVVLAGAIIEIYGEIDQNKGYDQYSIPRWRRS